MDDLTPFLRALINVMLEPYNELLHRLMAEGRVRRDELEALRAILQHRMEDLPPLVDAELRKSGWTGWSDGDMTDDEEPADKVIVTSQ
jgi:hypothetical protein